MVDDLFLLGLRALGYAPRLLLATGDCRALVTLLDVAMVGAHGVSPVPKAVFQPPALRTLGAGRGQSLG